MNLLSSVVKLGIVALLSVLLSGCFSEEEALIANEYNWGQSKI